MCVCGCVPEIKAHCVNVLQTGMPGMKRDCGGAAGILGAFLVAMKMVRALPAAKMPAASVYNSRYDNQRCDEY